jgi:geranylgeranyl diphosphate synthase type I
MKQEKKTCRKSSRTNKGKTSDERLLKDVEKILAKRGKKALEIVRREVLEEKIECKEACEALHYFIIEYWHDLARPTLLSLCCEAVGGNPDATVPFAVSLSLISGALDIHDDIIDQSKTKYGRPTVYGKYGKEIALLAADALLFKGFTLLQKACMQIPDEKATKIIDIVKNMFYELGDAEAMELRLRGTLDVTPEEYLHIIEKKAADTEAHARIGAIIGNATEIKQENLGKYGRLLGIASIIRDDIFDLFDSREAKHRVKKEHLPLPLIYSLTQRKNKSLICASLSKKNIRSFIRDIGITGGFKLTREFMEKIVQQASTCIKETVKNNQVQSQFLAIIGSLLIDSKIEKNLPPPSEYS